MTDGFDENTDLDALLDDATMPGICVFKCATPGAQGAEGCWLGGRPTLPPSLTWPFYSDGTYGDIPLVFLAQIDLAQLPLSGAQSGLPEIGTLFFFFEPLRGALNDFDEGGARVLYTPDSVAGNRQTKMPKYPAFPPDAAFSRWKVQGKQDPIPRWNINFVEIEGVDTDLIRTQEFHAAAWGIVTQMTDSIHKRYADLQGTRKALLPKLHNMLVGPDAAGWERSQVPLLSIWHDADLALFHADQRALVFSISENDLANLNFDATRLVDAG